MNIILPVGISFYTFQTMGYSIDVYRQRLTPTKSFIDFCAFASFFPILLAGPIERATNLLLQFYVKRYFDYGKAVDGLRQILWGLFKKIVIADSCAEYANIIFNNSSEYSGSTLLLGVLFFTFQIYCDFSGYSDIAIGTAKLFGFKLMRNFNFPYFSRDIAEFWRRWHISLSTWLNDYLFLPLNMFFRDFKKVGTIISIFITFFICGLWHGESWTYIIWGIINAIYFVPLLLFKTSRENNEIVAKGRIFPSLKDVTKIFITFTLTVFAWIFFRAESLSHAANYISGIFSASLISIPTILPIPTIVLTLLFLITEWVGRENHFAIEKLWINYPLVIRWGFYYGIVILIFIYAGKKQQFIYFQF
ncbi:MAG: MBOAT family protein [Ignavibacteriaceae bacterium]